MTAGDWVAASVRARSMTERRAGRGTCDAVARARDLEAARAILAGSAYGERLATVTDLAAAQHAVLETVLWRLRVLAGWMPATGTRLAAALAAGFERDDLVALAAGFSGARPRQAPFDLGALATAWPRARQTTTLPELTAALAHSAWGPLGEVTSAGDLRDVLTVSWLRRLASVAPSSAPWVAAAVALIAARTAFADQAVPSARFGALARPCIGDAWRSARTLPEFRAALPPRARTALDGVAAPHDLWSAEARLRTGVETDAFRLLRSAPMGDDVVLAAVTLLWIDALRVVAALALAEAGGAPAADEVLDVVA